MTSSDSSTGSATRRKVLGWGGLGAVGGIAAYLGWSQNGEAPHAQATHAATPPTPKPATVAETAAVAEEPAATAASGSIERAAFVPHVQSEFTLIHEGDNSATCRLIEVSPETRITSGKQSYVAFTLLFEASPFFLREGGNCRVQHSKMGEMQFYLSPVGKPGRTALLEAAFTLAAA